MSDRLHVVVFDETLQELRIDGLRFSVEVLTHLTPTTGEWTRPIWFRRRNDVIEVTTIAPARTSETRHVA